MKTGIELIADERKRQIEEEGYTKEHDVNHDALEFIYAIEAYAESAKIDASGVDYDEYIRMMYKTQAGLHCWPWGECTFKPGHIISDLTKLGALAAACIDLIMLKEREK
jgi:hypothetical protein